MSLDFSSGGAFILDRTVDPPHIVFDSAERLFHCTEPGPIVGDITLPARVATVPNGNQAAAVPYNAVNIHDIAEVHPDADIVLGGFKVTTAGNAEGISGLGVYDAGGTYVHVMEGTSGLSAPWAPSRAVPVTMAMYTFFAADGWLRLREDVFVSLNGNAEGITRTRTLLSVKFDFKLYVGTLT